MLDSERSEVRILCLGIGVGRYLPGVQSHSMYAIEFNPAKIRSRRRAARDGLTALTFPNSRLVLFVVVKVGGGVQATT
jgi:hypothetical protein